LGINFGGIQTKKLGWNLENQEIFNQKVGKMCPNRIGTWNKDVLKGNLIQGPKILTWRPKIKIMGTNKSFTVFF